MNLGIARHKSGHLDQAVNDLNRAIACNSKLVEAYGARGLVWEEKGELDRAIEDYGQAIRLDSQRASTYSRRGRAFIRKRTI